MIRARVVVVEDGHVAYMRREREPSRVYYVLPGGGVEAGETPEQAAIREAHEEPGLIVRIERLLMIVQFRDDQHYCFLATPTGGRFGTGAGPEFTERQVESSGTYHPVWLALDDIAGRDVRPKPVAEALASGMLLSDTVVRTVIEPL